MKKQNICWLWMTLLFLCMVGCEEKQRLPQVSASEVEGMNVFNRLRSRDFDESPSIFWFDEETGVTYFVNRESDYYIYQLEGNEAKLVVDIPAQELYMYDGLLYFMVENYDNRELVDIHLGDIYCYNPKDNTVNLVYEVEKMDEKGVQHDLIVNENGIYFSYMVEDEIESTQDKHVYQRYDYWLPFGATEPVKDELAMTKSGWEEYELLYIQPFSLVSRTKGIKDTKELSINPYRYAIVGDILYSVSLGNRNLSALNLKTGEQIEYDFSEVIEAKDIVTGEPKSLSGIVIFHSFIITEKEIWLAGTNKLYHMDLETKEINWYLLGDDATNVIQIRGLYMAGDELYAEINTRFSGIEYKLVRIITDKVEKSNYYIKGYREFFLNVEEIKK